MVQAIGQYGSNMKLLNYHELKVPILKKEVEYTKKIIEKSQCCIDEVWSFYYVWWVDK